jgi:hypothetical protein
MPSVIKKGRTASFTVDLFSCHSTHTVIHLPKECKLSSDPSILVEETIFIDRGNGIIATAQGVANTELLVAASIIIQASVNPYDEIDGVRVVVAGDHLSIVARLFRVSEYRQICEKVGFAVYDDVSAVDVRCMPMSDRFYQEHREYRYRQLGH